MFALSWLSCAYLTTPISVWFKRMLTRSCLRAKHDWDVIGKILVLVGWWSVFYRNRFICHSLLVSRCCVVLTLLHVVGNNLIFVFIHDAFNLILDAFKLALNRIQSLVRLIYRYFRSKLKCFACRKCVFSSASDSRGPSSNKAVLFELNLYTVLLVLIDAEILVSWTLYRALTVKGLELGVIDTFSTQTHELILVAYFVLRQVSAQNQRLLLMWILPWSVTRFAELIGLLPVFESCRCWFIRLLSNGIYMRVFFTHESVQLLWWFGTAWRSISRALSRP